MGPISEPTLEQSRRSGGPHNLGTPQAYGSFHLRIFVESNPRPSPPLPSVVSRRNKREKNRTRSFHFPPNFAGGNTTRSRVFSSPTRRSRRRRRSSSVAVEFNQLGYSSLNFQRWKRIAAMQG
ncbi:hypothetical protein MRB53_019488 [Persea americana]|uniref:Uncharacterized protein n=1 Tax=Persea americana TaxID=3435 RepID=A0ACC2KZ69_PERAE|nr:hypothetical protein MRB53_019488 [Persea americana]